QRECSSAIPTSSGIPGDWASPSSIQATDSPVIALQRCTLDRARRARCPTQRLRQSVLEGDSGPPPQRRGEVADVRLHVSLSTWPGGSIAALPGGLALVDCTEHRIGEPIDRQPPAAADVEDPPESPFVFQRRHPGANYVGNVDEVPALLAVAEN